MELKQGYKQTEAGLIPAEWSTPTLEQHCCKLNVGFVGVCEPYYTNEYSGVMLIRTGNLYDQKFNFEDMKYVTHSFHKTNKKSQTKGGDILIARHGSSGSAVLVPSCVDDANTLNIVVIRTVSDELDNIFAQYAINSAGVKRQVLEVTAGSTQGVINTGAIAKLIIPRPSIIEQRAIAKALSDTDALIESLEQLIAKKRHIKQGAMQVLFCPKTGDEVRLLRDVSTLKGRIGWQGLNQTEFTSNEDEPFLITGMNFKDGAIRWNEVYHISESRYEMAKDIQLKTGDVLMTKDGTIGKVLYIDTIPCPGKASLNSHLLLFRPIKEIYNSRYLYYQLSSQRFKDFIELSKYGTTFFGISQAAVGNYPVLLPPIEDQVRTATILSDMDAEIAALESKLAKTRQLKQGMMHNLLTGRIRLVPAVSKVIPFPGKKESVTASTKSHNWQINEAVIIAVLAKHFGSEEYPLARKRCTKLTYLLHRHVERKAEGYLKKAAGPYNPATKYKGPEAIAQKNGYIRLHHNGTYPGFVAAANISQAEAYFQQWYGPDALAWLKQFRQKKTDELELLATVDMAVEDLRREGKTVKLGAVKQVIHDHPEWEAKLQREIFSDFNIVRAIQICRELFA